MLEVPQQLPVVERRCEVLRQRVQRPLVAPSEQQVPLVGVLVDRVERGRDPLRVVAAARVGEARDRRVVAAALGAARDLRHARVAAEVDVQLTARAVDPDLRLLPDEALEVAAVAADRVDVVPATADLRGQWIRQPAGAVDGRGDPVGEALPARREGAVRLPRGARRRRVRGGDGRSAAAAPRREQGGRDRNACKQNDCPHGSMVDALPRNRCGARRALRSAPHPPGGNGPTRFQAYFRRAHETVTKAGKEWETSSPARSRCGRGARRPAAPCRRAR